MVAINLLPDLRQAKIRDLHRRQLAIGLGTLVVVISAGSVLALFLVLGGMKLQISNLSRQIADRQTQLEAIPNLPRALTVQKHLASLPGLYAQRSSYSRYLAVLDAASPTQIQLSSLVEDTTGMMTIIGKADSYATVGKYAEALKADPTRSILRLDSDKSTARNFDKVTISSVSADQRTAVSFTINATVAPELLAGRASNGQN